MKKIITILLVVITTTLFAQSPIVKQIGEFTEINDTSVYPSSRTSDRVPFGTGRAMLEWEDGLEKRNSSYHPESFLLLKVFLDMLPEIFFQDLNELRGLNRKTNFLTSF